MTSQMQWAQTETLIKTLSELKEEIVSLSLMKEQLASDIRQLSYKVSDLTAVSYTHLTLPTNREV